VTTFHTFMREIRKNNKKISNFNIIFILKFSLAYRT
jgi:hypothetical protein